MFPIFPDKKLRLFRGTKANMFVRDAMNKILEVKKHKATEDKLKKLIEDLNGADDPSSEFAKHKNVDGFVVAMVKRRAELVAITSNAAEEFQGFVTPLAKLNEYFNKCVVCLGQHFATAFYADVCKLLTEIPVDNPDCDCAAHIAACLDAVPDGACLSMEKLGSAEDARKWASARAGQGRFLDALQAALKFSHSSEIPDSIVVNSMCSELLPIADMAGLMSACAMLGQKPVVGDDGTEPQELWAPRRPVVPNT